MTEKEYLEYKEEVIKCIRDVINGYETTEAAMRELLKVAEKHPVDLLKRDPEIEEVSLELDKIMEKFRN